LLAPPDDGAEADEDAVVLLAREDAGVLPPMGDGTRRCCWSVLMGSIEGMVCARAGVFGIEVELPFTLGAGERRAWALPKVPRAWGAVGSAKDGWEGVLGRTATSIERGRGRL